MKITDRTEKIIEKESRLLSYTTRVPYYPLPMNRSKNFFVIMPHIDHCGTCQQV